MVRVAPEQSFVVADIPGLIEGAAEGAGLGHLFLRHLQRTRLLLHLVDFAPFDGEVDPVKQVKGIVKELEKYDPELAAKPRWIVLNKLDMIPAEERAERVAAFKKRLRWKGPVFSISALTREGCEPLVRAIYDHVKTYAVAGAGRARSALRRGRRRRRRRDDGARREPAPTPGDERDAARGPAHRRQGRLEPRHQRRPRRRPGRPSAAGAGRWRRWSGSSASWSWSRAARSPRA